MTGDVPTTTLVFTIMYIAPIAHRTAFADTVLFVSRSPLVLTACFYSQFTGNFIVVYIGCEYSCSSVLYLMYTSKRLLKGGKVGLTFAVAMDAGKWALE